MKGFSALSSDKSHLRLSHSYSRAKVKFNVNKSEVQKSKQNMQHRYVELFYDGPGDHF